MIMWYVASQKFSHRKRLHLRAYAILLLLNDTIRDDHKKKLTDWIRESDARTALNLHERADEVIEMMADHLAVSGNSLLAALSSLWNSEAASELSLELERELQPGWMKSRCSMNFNVQPYRGVLATLVVGWDSGRVAGHPSRSGGDGGLHRCVRLCGSGRHESGPGAISGP